MKITNSLAALLVISFTSKALLAQSKESTSIADLSKYDLLAKLEADKDLTWIPEKSLACIRSIPKELYGKEIADFLDKSFEKDELIKFSSFLASPAGRIYSTNAVRSAYLKFGYKDPPAQLSSSNRQKEQTSQFLATDTARIFRSLDFTTRMVQYVHPKYIEMYYQKCGFK